MRGQVCHDPADRHFHQRGTLHTRRPAHLRRAVAAGVRVRVRCRAAGRQPRRPWPVGVGGRPGARRRRGRERPDVGRDRPVRRRVRPPAELRRALRHPGGHLRRLRAEQHDVGARPGRAHRCALDRGHRVRAVHLARAGDDRDRAAGQGPGAGLRHVQRRRRGGRLPGRAGRRPDRRPPRRLERRARPAATGSSPSCPARCSGWSSPFA